MTEPASIGCMDCKMNVKEDITLNHGKLSQAALTFLLIAAIVDEKIFCCPGGLSPDHQFMEQIRRIMRTIDGPDQGILCGLTPIKMS